MRPAEIPQFTRFAQRWWRRFYWLRRDMPYILALHTSKPLLFAGMGGIGDELMTTALITKIYRDTKSPVVVFARYADLFEHNPAVAGVILADPVVLATADNWNCKIHRPFGWQKDVDEDRQAPPRKTLITEKALAAGLTGPIELRPRLYLLANELMAAQGEKPFDFVIQSSGIAAQWHIPNKEWGLTRFQQLADILTKRYRLVQVGSLEDPLLDGVEDRRGTTRRESAALIASSQGFIGQAGFLMHLARAVGKRSVIIFGGRERPDQSGYICNENLYTPLPCAPCWQRQGCDYDRACMSAITPAHVAAAVDRLLLRINEPLETTVHVL